MLEETQSHISELGIECPKPTGDKRHAESSEYPFMDYDILSDEEEEEDDRTPRKCHSYGHGGVCILTMDISREL
jgi:hypothetical protein